jgi:hypothetical protein
MAILEQALAAARGFRPMTSEQVGAILAATATVADNGKYELYKRTGRFDGTTQHPEWMG